MINRSSFPLAYYPALGLVLIAAFAHQKWLLIAALGYVLVIAAISLTLTFRTIRQRERYRRWLAKLCVNCGYNLEGNQSGVCPECGKPIVEQPPPPARTTKWF